MVRYRAYTAHAAPTYLAGLLSEFVPLFQTDFIHLGGDEVEDFTCWQQSASVQAFMKVGRRARHLPCAAGASLARTRARPSQRQGFTTMFQVRNYFQSRIQAIAANHTLSAVFWEEVFDGGYTLQPTSIVDVWLSDEELLNATATGKRVIECVAVTLSWPLPLLRHSCALATPPCALAGATACTWTSRRRQVTRITSGWCVLARVLRPCACSSHDASPAAASHIAGHRSQLLAARPAVERDGAAGTAGPGAGHERQPVGRAGRCGKHPIAHVAACLR